MKEIAENTGFFSGTFRLMDEYVYNGDDFLKVLHGDAFSANLLSASITGNVDCRTAPIYDVKMTHITSDSTIFDWKTEEECCCSLYVRELGTEDWSILKDGVLKKEHYATLYDLKPATRYEANISMIDAAGNFGAYTGPHNYISWTTDSREEVFSANMDEDPGWTLEGDWQWGIPKGMGTPSDPEQGFTGDSVIGFNLEGNYQNALSPKKAVSPPIDCSRYGEYTIEYRRWLGTDNYYFDSAIIEVLNRDGDWVTVWENPIVRFYDGEWVHHKIEVTEQACNNMNFQIAFIQGQTDSIFSSCGWNIDDVQVIGHYNSETLPDTQELATPELELILNHTDYFPGDPLRLLGILGVPSEPPAFGVIVPALIGEEYFFYPRWKPTFEAFFPGPIAAPQQQFLLLAFSWPNYSHDLSLVFAGATFDMKSTELLHLPALATCTFHSQ